MPKFSVVHQVDSNRRPSTMAMASLVPRPHWTLPRTNPRGPGFPRPRSGSRSGPAPVEKHETGPISYLIVTSTERASRQRSSRVAASSYVSPRPQSNTCAYPIVCLCIVQ
jgi:hypothetical protein